MSHEFKTLLSCLQSIGSNEENTQLSTQLRNIENWDYFIEIAQRHKVTPLVYREFNQYYSQHIPNSVMNTLKTYHKNKTIRMMQLTSELLRLNTLFQNADIPFISFKGPLLAQRIYGDLTLREPGDLDILISEDNILSTHDILIQQGYQLYSVKKSPKNLRIFSRYHNDIGYFHPHKKILIEVHWRFFKNPHEFIFPINKLFENKETVVLSGCSFLRLPIEIELLYLLYHGSKHSWTKLFWLCDIKQYLTHTTINWDNLLAFAKEIKAERPFLEGLMLAKQLLHIPLDPIIEKNFHQNKKAKSLAKTSTYILMQSKKSTIPMRWKMLRSRFKIREFSVPFYKAFFGRLLMRLFRVI